MKKLFNTTVIFAYVGIVGALMVGILEGCATDKAKPIPPIALRIESPSPPSTPCFTNLTGTIGTPGFSWSVTGGGTNWTGTTISGTSFIGDCTITNGPVITITGPCSTNIAPNIATITGTCWDGTEKTIHISFLSCITWEQVRIASCCNPLCCLTYCVLGYSTNCCNKGG